MPLKTLHTVRSDGALHSRPTSAPGLTALARATSALGLALLQEQAAAFHAKAQGKK
jgi:hypothetical protein